MSSKKYGEEMSKILHFTPKKQSNEIYNSAKKRKPSYNPGDRMSGNNANQVFVQGQLYQSDVPEENIEQQPKLEKRLHGKFLYSKGKVNGRKAPAKKVMKDPNVSKVVEKERRKAILDSLKPTKGHRRVFLVFVVMIILLSMFVSFFYLSSKITSVRYGNLELKKQYEIRQSEKKELETKLEANNRSDYIEKIAREQLGMNYPRPDQIVYIKSN